MATNDDWMTEPFFFQHTAGVTMLKFANNDRSRLCCASLDGTVSICNVTASPPYVEVVLKGHRKGVTGNSILSYDSTALTFFMELVMSYDDVGVGETRNSCVFFHLLGYYAA